MIYHHILPRHIQQNTFDLMSKCSEIDRLILIKSPNVREIIDQTVRKTVDTQRLLERYGCFAAADTNADPKYKRLAENFARASSKLEESMRRYSDRVATPEPTQSTQLKVMHDVNRSFPKAQSSKPISGYEYISSLEEGVQCQTLQDLNRVNREMNSLQDIYYSLSEVATSQQGSVIDSVQAKLSQAGHTASSAVQELARAKDRMDYWTRIKVYSVTGAAAVGLFFWIL